MSASVATVRSLYEAFARGDMPAVLGALAADVHWTEAEGGPYGGVSVGPQAVLDNVFMKLGADWDGYTASPEEFIADGDTVVVLGQYSAIYKATGKPFKAPFAHVWRLQDGKVQRFQQYTDTHLHRLPTLSNLRRR